MRRIARPRCDATLVPEIERIWRACLRVYGADKISRQPKQEGIIVMHCTVDRLMRQARLHGVVRYKFMRTTFSNPGTRCPFDEVNRQFRADRANQLWGSDFKCVPAWLELAALEWVA